MIDIIYTDRKTGRVTAMPTDKFQTHEGLAFKMGDNGTASTIHLKEIDAPSKGEASVEKECGISEIQSSITPLARLDRLDNVLDAGEKEIKLPHVGPFPLKYPFRMIKGYCLTIELCEGILEIKYY